MQKRPENFYSTAAQALAVLVPAAAPALLVPYSASKPAKEERKTNETTLGDGLRQVEGQWERWLQQQEIASSSALLELAHTSQLRIHSQQGIADFI